MSEPVVRSDAVTEGGERKRCFLAVDLSVTTTRRIADAIEALRKPAQGAGIKVAWVPAANLHVTLKFLGSIRAEAVEAARDAAREVATGEGAFELRASGAGAFPSTTRARVLWVGLKGSEALSRVARKLEERLGELGFDREERAFHPHVTIGRIKDDAGPGVVDKLIAPFVDKDFGASGVRELVLYESRTLPAGAEYVPLARLPFVGGSGGAAS